MTSGLAQYLKALDDAQVVIDMVQPDQWEAQSPCEDWKATDVVGHLVGGLGMARSLATTGEMGTFATTREAAGADPKASFEAARAATVAAFTAENLARIVNSPFGQMPLAQFLGVITLDVIAHTWDLSRAIGHDVTLDPELVHDRFEAVKPLDAMLRQPGLFGPRVEPPSGADEQTQLMAFLGRDVGSV